MIWLCAVDDDGLHSALLDSDQQGYKMYILLVSFIK